MLRPDSAKRLPIPPGLNLPTRPGSPAPDAAADTDATTPSVAPILPVAAPGDPADVSPLLPADPNQTDPADEFAGANQFAVADQAGPDGALDTACTGALGVLGKSGTRPGGKSDRPGRPVAKPAGPDGRSYGLDGNSAGLDGAADRTAPDSATTRQDW